MPRLSRFILIVSLSLNLALAVAVGWLAWQSNRAMPEVQTRQPRAMFHSDALRRALPPERGVFVDRILAQHRESMRAHIEQLNHARAQVRQAIRAEPFTRHALDDAFAQLREAEGGAAQEAHTLLSELVEQAEPQERARLARLVPERRGRRARRADHARRH